MDNRILKKFYNYISTADKKKNSQPKLYYFLKSYAFKYIFDYLEESNIIPISERNNIIRMNDDYFGKETKDCTYGYDQITDQEYYNFLEDIAKEIDQNSLDNLYLMRDLLQVSFKFGVINKNIYDRINYYDKKIASILRDESNLVFNSELVNVPDYIKNSMDMFPKSISKNDNNYFNYTNSIIQILQASTNDLDNRNTAGFKEKIDSALYYLDKIHN